jgi:hypothetical protein
MIYDFYISLVKMGDSLIMMNSISIWMTCNGGFKLPWNWHSSFPLGFARCLLRAVYPVFSCIYRHGVSWIFCLSVSHLQYVFIYLLQWNTFQKIGGNVTTFLRQNDVISSGTCAKEYEECMLRLYGDNFPNFTNWHVYFRGILGHSVETAMANSKPYP